MAYLTGAGELKAASPTWGEGDLVLGIWQAFLPTRVGGVSHHLVTCPGVPCPAGKVFRDGKDGDCKTPSGPSSADTHGVTLLCSNGQNESHGQPNQEVGK